jgi:hypothetical protein
VSIPSEVYIKTLRWWRSYSGWGVSRDNQGCFKQIFFQWSGRGGLERDEECGSGDDGDRAGEEDGGEGRDLIVVRGRVAAALFTDCGTCAGVGGAAAAGC